MKKTGGRKRYRFKLNLLGPGAAMCGAAALLFLGGLLLNLCGLTAASLWAWALAVLLFAVLLVLLGIEQHQDKQLYLDAKKHDPEIK